MNRRICSRVALWHAPRTSVAIATNSVRDRDRPFSTRHTDIARHAFPAAAPAAAWSSSYLGDRTAHVLLVGDAAASRAGHRWRLRAAPALRPTAASARRCMAPAQGAVLPLRPFPA